MSTSDCFMVITEPKPVDEKNHLFVHIQRRHPSVVQVSTPLVIVHYLVGFVLGIVLSIWISYIGFLTMSSMYVAVLFNNILVS